MAVYYKHKARIWKFQNIYADSTVLQIIAQSQNHFGSFVPIYKSGFFLTEGIIKEEIWTPEFQFYKSSTD